jgi:hypothetical protein
LAGVPNLAQGSVEMVRLIGLIVLIVLMVGVRHCPLHTGVAPRARLPRGHAAPEGRGRPVELACVVLIGGS